MRRVLLALLVVVAALVACSSTFEPDFPTGTPLPSPTATVITSPVFLNECAKIVAATNGGRVQVAAAPSMFPVGQRVLLHLVSDDPMTADAIEGGLSLFLDTMMNVSGQFRRAVVSTVIESGSTTIVEVGVDATLYDGQAPRRAQLCTMPVFSTLEITTSGSVHAHPWNGKHGGVIAIEVTGDFLLDGALVASNSGFAGGAPSFASTVAGCTATTTVDVTGSSGQRGRSIGGDDDAHGRGRLANGGGGGNCFNAGGGGGGNGGIGGRGGFESGGIQTVPTWGIGGARLVSGNLRLILGGGGGGGHQDAGSDTRGGKGGGAVLVLAHRMGGSGVISIAGEDAPDVPTCEGAGGGGAGGSLFVGLQDTTLAHTIFLDGHGGAGGSITNVSASTTCGPGGGGGGARVSRADIDFPLRNLQGGPRGTNVVGGNVHGATGGGNGAY